MRNCTLAEPIRVMLAAIDREAIRTWLDVLDTITTTSSSASRTAPTPTPSSARSTSSPTRSTPTRTSGRPDDERGAIARIFRRGNEAYRVLEDPTLRAQYDESLAQGAPPSVAARRSQAPPASIAPRPEAPRGLDPHAGRTRGRSRRAEELVKAGDWKQAKLQLTMARHSEPQNPALEEMMQRVDEKVRGK